jgi:hypothetical protein
MQTHPDPAPHHWTIYLACCRLSPIKIMVQYGSLQEYNSSLFGEIVPASINTYEITNSTNAHNISKPGPRISNISPH